MKTLNLSAIAASSFLTGIAIFSFFTSAQASEINLPCNTKQGSTTTIALNTEDAIFLRTWSISDAIGMAYVVRSQCQDQSIQSSTAPAPRYIVTVNLAPNSQTPIVQKKVLPVTIPITVKATPAPSPSSELW
jgi:predicted carbohydrate-binding protein with CBM5 and CBM33 domain